TADAGGFGSNADANDDDQGGVHIGLTNARTRTEVRSSARLEAARVELTANVPTVSAVANSYAHAAAFGADCDSKAHVENHDTTEVDIRSGAQVTGTSGVVITSHLENIITIAYAKSDFDGGLRDPH